MPILQPSDALPRYQRRFDVAIVIVLGLIGVLLGIWEAWECAAVKFGYVAGYSYATAVFGAGFLAVVGILFVIYWRTRWLGIGLMGLGLLSCVTFYGAMWVLVKADRVAWRHEPPPVRFGPDQRASLVIYFRKGVTDKDIERFISAVLEEDARPRHEGRDHPVFVESYLRLLPSQANGFEACAITFRPATGVQNRADYVGKIKGDARVEQVFLDKAPAEIDLHSAHSTESSHHR